MERMNLPYDEDEVKKLFGKMDRNKDGKIQFDEWQVKSRCRDTRQRHRDTNTDTVTHRHRNTETNTDTQTHIESLFSPILLRLFCCLRHRLRQTHSFGTGAMLSREISTMR